MKRSWLPFVALATSLLISSPARAQNHSGFTHFIEKNIACDGGNGTFFEIGGFSRFVSKHGQHVWTGGFSNGLPNQFHPLAGISVRPTTAVSFKNWSLDVNLSGFPSGAYSVTVFRDDNVGYVDFWANSSGNVIPGQVSNFSSKTLANGTQRWTFTGVPSTAFIGRCNNNNPGVTVTLTNPKFAGLYFIQYASNNTSKSSSDMVTNVMVNGVAATITPGPITFDCTPDDTCNDVEAI